MFAGIGKRPQQMTVILVYDDQHPKYPGLRVRLYIDHCCAFQKEQAVLNVNGSNGALKGTFQSILNETAGYNNYTKDTLKVKVKGIDKDIHIQLKNSWMYQAFYGPISNIQRYINGQDKHIWTNMQSCFDTQLLVYALKLSDKNRAFVNMKDVHNKHGVNTFIRSKL